MIFDFMKNQMQQIYVRLIDGVEVFVPVVARQLDEDVYEIMEIPSFDLDDFSSIWQFFPGDVVRCEKKIFHNKNFGLLANELISSTFPDRKLHELIFLIVYSQGKVAVENLQGFQKEIKQFCNSHTVFQKNSVIPAIKDWVYRCCKL